ncbi:MAG: 2Fe-2S iron-sulfur cluster-binding protein [Acidobacteriota bacterium]
MPNLTINGQSVTVDPGTSVLQAARSAGIEVPHFCWHPYLTVAGNCRMCLVEIEKQPKLAISCATPAAEGMVARFDTEKVKDAVQGVLEFELVNHPIDCPICDQAGECYLQDYYMEVGLHDSRIDREDKVGKGKTIDLGPIVLDQERCVLCSRCVRYTTEISKTGELYIFDRGDRCEIRTFADRPLTGEYTGNLADVCPVGALTSRDFRFKKRVWFLKPTASVCQGCATGCSIWVDWEKTTVYRLRPRDNPHVNKLWMCDPGRATYRAIGSPDRAVKPEIRETGSGLTTVAWERAIKAAAEALAEGPVGVMLPASLSLEDMAAGSVLLEVLGCGEPACWLVPEQDDPAASLDGILRKADPFPNTNGAALSGLIPHEGGRGRTVALVDALRSGAIKTVLVASAQDLARGETGASLLAELSRIPNRIVLASHAGPWRDAATVFLPQATWAEREGTTINGDGRLQRYRKAIDPPGGARAAFEIFLAILGAMGHPRKETTAREIFRFIASEVPRLHGITYERIGQLGIAVPAEAPVAAPA